jgi:hypothetical protein
MVIIAMILFQLAQNKGRQLVQTLQAKQTASRLKRLFKKTLVFAGLGIASLTLTACAGSAKKKPAPITQEYQTLDPNSPEYIEAMLIQKSSEATEAQKAYVMIVAEQQQAKEEKQAAFDTEYIEVQNFIGKPNSLLKALAHRYGYEYREEGFAKNLPTLNLDIKNDPPIEVLKQISYQINSVADMIVDKDQKIIRLIYRQGK